MFAQVEFGLCDEKECISIILDNEEQVNEFMLMLIEKSFIVNRSLQCHNGHLRTQNQP